MDKVKKGLLLSQGGMKRPLMIMALLLLTASAYAQDGSAGIQAANTQIRGYFDVGTQLMYGIGGLLALIGATKVYQKWNQGDQDTSKVAASWFGSCIFLVVVTMIIRSFFGL